MSKIDYFYNISIPKESETKQDLKKTKSMDRRNKKSDAFRILMTNVLTLMYVNNRHNTQLLTLCK